MVTHGAHVGVALDGDADRLVMCDETGRLIDGDQLMALIAERWQAMGRLSGNGVVATVMSNLGLEHYIKRLGLDFHRVGVGDRYVQERMRSAGCNVGGEQSGHVILSDFATTGDGLIAALQVLAVLADTGLKASEVCRRFEPLPQLLRNVRFGGGAPLQDSSVQRAIAAGERRLGAGGRVLIRASGTEPLIRVMAEGQDQELVAAVVGDIVAALERAAA